MDATTPIRPSRARRALRATALLALAVSLTGCGSKKIDSIWRDRELTIDGDLADWRDATVDNDKTETTVGVMNDSEFLYIGLALWNEAHQLQALTGGLTIWFDPTGEKLKTFGIRYPMGVAETKFEPISRDDGGPPRVEDVFKLAIENQLDLVVEQKGRRTRMRRAIAPGIEVALGYRQDRLFYELKVPLAKGEHGIGIAPGAKIQVGVDAPKLDLDKVQEDMAKRPDRWGRPVPDRPAEDSADREPADSRWRDLKADPVGTWVRVTLAKRKDA